MTPRRFYLILILLLSLMATPFIGYAQEMQTYGDDSITFQYPAGWAQCPCDPAENTIAVGNTEEALHATQGEFAGEMIQVMIIKSYKRQSGSTVEVLSASEVARQMREQATVTYENMHKLTFGDRGAFRMDFAGESLGTQIEGITITVELGNGDVAVMMAVMPVGQLATFENEVMAIAETISLPGEMASQPVNGTLVTFQTPADWAMLEADSNLVVMASTQETLDRVYQNDRLDVEQLQKGEAVITLYKSMNGFLGNVIDVSASPETYAADLPFFLGYEDVTLGDVEQQANFAYVTGSGSTIEVAFVIVDPGNGDKSLLTLVTRLKHLTAFENVLLELAQTVSLTDTAPVTDTASNSANPSLDGSFSMVDGSLSFNYPQAWDAQEYEGLIFMVNNTAIYDREDPFNTLQGDELIVVIYPSPDLNGNYPAATGNENASTVISFYASMHMALGDTITQPMDVQTLDNGNEISTVGISTQTADLVVIAVSSAPGQVITIEAYLAPGQMDQYWNTLIPMAETLVQ